MGKNTRVHVQTWFNSDERPLFSSHQPRSIALISCREHGVQHSCSASVGTWGITSVSSMNWHHHIIIILIKRLTLGFDVDRQTDSTWASFTLRCFRVGWFRFTMGKIFKSLRYFSRNAGSISQKRLFALLSSSTMSWCILGSWSVPLTLRMHPCLKYFCSCSNTDSASDVTCSCWWKTANFWWPDMRWWLRMWLQIWTKTAYIRCLERR